MQGLHHQQRCCTTATRAQIPVSVRRAAAKAAEQQEQKSRIQQSDVQIIVECSFSGGSRAGRELKSLVRQLENADVVNRKHQTPCRLHASSFGSSLTNAANNLNLHTWWMSRSERPAHEMITEPDLTKVVVLSPDAQEELENVRDGRIYIIGGLVDRTVHKNQTLFYAAKHGFQVRRLPLEESLTFKGVGSKNAKWKVLNIDAVVLALLEARRTDSWMIALDAAVPERKRRLQPKKPPRLRLATQERKQN